MAQRHEDGVMAVVRSAGADMRPRDERGGGDGVLGRTLARADERRKKGGDEAPFIGDMAGSVGRLTGGATRRRGVGKGRGPVRRSGGAVWPTAARPRHLRVARMRGA
jgi:hypothetical protein